MTKIKIESTETGDVFNMRMEPTIEKMKFQVSLLVPIPPHDQIMLIGPPYKILDSLYSPDMNVEGKRIFVFNRRILSDTAKEPQRIRLQPYEVSRPDLSLDHSLDVPIGGPQGAEASDSSVVRTMEYEHYFQTQLKKAQCFEQYVQESYKTCKQSVAQHQVQLDGIGAAISNLQYFHRSIDKTCTSLENTLSEQQNRHAALLGNFDSSLQRLAAVPLHPALRAAIQEYQAHGASLASSVATAAASVSASTTAAAQGGTAGTAGPAGGAAPVEFTTLLDCIPVERERVYLAQCAVNHKKVDENLRRVRGLHQEVQAGVNELQLPQVDFEHLRNLLDSVNQESAAVSDLMRRFRRDYQFVYDHITMTSSPRPQQLGSVSTPAFLPGATVGSFGSETQTHSGSSPDHREGGALGTQGGAVGPIDSLFAASSVVSAADSTLTTAPAVSPGDDSERVLGELQRRKNSQEGGHYLDQLEACARRVRDVKNEIERSQNWLLGAIYRTMRQIALLQTDIQYKLKRDVDWMKKLTQGHNEYFLHLEQIDKLPIIYQHLLNEIVRRRNYNVLFESEVIAASEKIAAFRREETRQREGFMQNYGLHLPPIFFKAIPTLKDKPPYFSPTLTDPQWLPEVSSEDVDRQCIATEFSLGVSEGAAGGGRSEVTGLEAGGGDAHKEALLRRFAAAGNEMSAMSHASEVPQSPLPTGAMTTGQQQAGERGADSPHSFEPSTGTGAAEAAANLGGSVILRAEPVAREDTYQRLALQCSRLEYQNAQYVRIIAELLAERKGGQALPDAISIALPPSAAPTPSKATRPSGEAGAEAASVTTAAVGATAEDTATEVSAAATDAAEASASMKEPQSDAAQAAMTPSTRAAETELQGKLSKVGVLNQLMAGYTQLRRMITADSATQAYLTDLESHGHVPPLGTEVVLYGGDETYIEHPSGQVRPIRDTIEAVTHAVHALVFGLNQQLSNPRISFMDFKAGDIALFLPAAAENRKIWMAYHASTPSRYLAEESLLAFENRNKNREPLVRIMGRIVLIDTKVSSLEDNPFNLLPGSTYYVCYVEPLKLRGIKKRAAALAAHSASASTSVVTVRSESGDAAAGEVSAEGAALQAGVRGLTLQHPTAAGGTGGAGREEAKVPTPSGASGTKG